MRSAWRPLSPTLAASACLALCIPICHAQSLECPVIASSGSVNADGTVLTLGQLADSYLTNGVDEIREGAVPCWTVAEAPLPGDLDGDGDVDLSDLAGMLAAYGACEGDPEFNPAADIDGSGCVDLFDLGTLLSHYGEGA
jgi:hypothetical protein